MEETSGTTVQVQPKLTNETTMAVVDPLTDAALAAGGMQKVTAYVRTAQSANALRKQRAREKAEQQGLKQLNIQLPVQMHQTLKDIAQELQQSDDVVAALQNVLAKLPHPKAVPVPAPVARKVGHLRGWRGLLARLLKVFRPLQ